MCVFPAEVKLGDHSAFLFHFHTVNKCALCILFSAMFFAFLCFVLVIQLFKMPPKHSAEMLSSVPKSNKAVMGLTEKIQLTLDQHRFELHGSTCMHI